VKRAPRGEARGGEAIASVRYNPQRGVRISLDLDTALAGWHEIARVQVRERAPWPRILPGQRLPEGFLWADPEKQNFGMSGPFLAYGPIERRCRDCREMFTWSAAAQQHLYETIGAIVDTTATRCQACARARRKREEARVAYADALRALEAAPSAAGHLRVAKAILELLRAGGRTSLEKAIGHCTRARKLGAAASVDAVERSLRALR
jgi:hypothetical protein